MVWNVVLWSAMLLGSTRTNGVIKQSPEQITVTEGGTAQLNCSYISKINDTRKVIGAITWYKDEENRTVCNWCSGFHGRVRTNSSMGILSQSVQIVDVRKNDTGKYYCRAHLLGRGVYLGKGTQVTVIPLNPRSLRWQLTEIGLKLAVFALINIVTVFGICTWGTSRALIATNLANSFKITRKEKGPK
ncbi:natural cytotoxicity triggering receptor 3-like [Mobula birostris]|uniref:natural cytotoxicity triggering receptor 3-like n=1 Tax=Mobula birostris TaxID=1983395 RepID=UPI003B283655